MPILVYELIAIAVVAWIFLLIPQNTQASRTIIAVVAVVLAVFAMIHSGALGNL